jgi:ParB family chromosome partitioning protein
MLGWATISAVVAPEGTDPQEIALLENVQRSQLTPLEEADAVIRLQERNGWTQDQTAKALGKSRIHVAEMARLTRLPAWLREEYASHIGGVSAGLLLEIGLARTEKVQALLWDRAKAGALTVAEARRIRAAEDKPDSPSAEAAAPRPSLVAKALRAVGKLNQDLASIHQHREALDDAARAELNALRRRIDEILG